MGSGASHPASSVTYDLLRSEMKTLNHLPQTPKQPENSKFAPPLPYTGPETQAVQSWECIQ